MINYWFDFEKFVMKEALFNQSFNKYLLLKRNSKGFNIRYFITICIDSI